MDEKLTPKRELVMVVVLGELGHSPRMNYHALSLAEEGFEVNLVGYSGSKPQVEILTNEHITLTHMRPMPKWAAQFRGIFGYAVKIVWQAVVLFFTLITCCKGKYLLLQNPPAVPAMPVCWFYCLLTRTKFYIDWHNYGFTILALTLKKGHPLVWVYRVIEIWFGRLAHGGFCVTKAMQIDLEIKWHITKVTVLYDRPAARFKCLSLEEKHNFLVRMSVKYPCLGSSCSPDRTMFTECFADGRVSVCEDRPALVVSSTSWTEDEDFSIFLHALSDYERVRAEFPHHYPPLVVAVTGKGPLKEHYEILIAGHKWNHVAFITPWLSAEDYPKLLACADLGVCLHYSSSGLDLPMKVVDMFGCRVPVMAVEYLALPELVKHNENGLVFRTKEELADLLQDWFRGFPHETAVKETYYDFYAHLDEFKLLTWHKGWMSNALPMFRSVN